MEAVPHPEGRVQIFLDLLVVSSSPRLALEASQPGAELGQDILNTLQVAAGRFEPPEGLLPTAPIQADAGCLLE
jgi:hypothetical protein